MFCSGHCFAKEVALSECLWHVDLEEGDKDICGIGWGRSKGDRGCRTVSGRKEGEYQCKCGMNVKSPSVVGLHAGALGVWSTPGHDNLRSGLWLMRVVFHTQ